MRGHLNLGNILLKTNNSKEAEMAYRTATHLLEESANTYHQISSMHLTALFRLSQLISRDPHRTQEAFLSRRQVLALKSDFKPMFESWTKELRSSANGGIEAAVMLAEALQYESTEPDVLYNVSNHRIRVSNLIHYLSFIFVSNEKFHTFCRVCRHFFDTRK